MADNKWQISDEFGEKMVPLLPEHKTYHPLGTYRRRVYNSVAMKAIFFVLRTGCQWNAGVFERFWQNGLLACGKVDAIDWSWLSMDGCMIKSLLAGSKKQVATRLTEGNGE